MARIDRGFYAALKCRKLQFDQRRLVALFERVSEERVQDIAINIAAYILHNLPQVFSKRENLSDYRSNPYVLMTAASVLDLSDPAQFARFLFDSKLYMALETSFGKSIEAALVGPYPVDSLQKWKSPVEKEREFRNLDGLSREERAAARSDSAWREIDESVFGENRRFLVSIKSGPNTINDTQVTAMVDAIDKYHSTWLDATKQVSRNAEIDIVIGLTYGTECTTNNKENQLLAKLLTKGFIEEDRRERPGVLIDEATRQVRVYRRVGQDFWAMIGNPTKPEESSFVFLEILLGLARGLALGIKDVDFETKINMKIQVLRDALGQMQFPRNSLPAWVRQEFSTDELFWFATALTAFYDEGI